MLNEKKTAATQIQRKRYIPPQVCSSETFERLALSCSGTSGGTAKGGGRSPPPCTTQFS